MGCPMVVVYKTSAITYFLGCLLVKVPNIGMVNVVAGRRLCPELIQGAATPEALASAMSPLIEETSERVTMKRWSRRSSPVAGAGGCGGKGGEHFVGGVGIAFFRRSRLFHTGGRLEAVDDERGPAGMAAGA